MRKRQNYQLPPLLQLLCAIVGLIGGLVGLAGGSLLLWDRLSPPGVEILSVMPTCLHSKENPHNWLAEGVAFLVHFRANQQTVFIGGIDVKGKVYLDTNEYMGYLGNRVEGRHIDEIDAERKEKKPYFTISWSGWPEEGRVAIRLEPREERYVCFTVLAPTLLTGMPKDDRFLGLEAENRKPTLPMQSPSVFHIFEQRVNARQEVYSYDVRNELRSGLIQLSIRVGSKQISVGPDKIRDFYRMPLQDWEQRSASEIALQPDKLWEN